MLGQWKKPPIPDIDIDTYYGIRAMHVDCFPTDKAPDLDIVHEVDVSKLTQRPMIQEGIEHHKWADPKEALNFAMFLALNFSPNIFQVETIANRTKHKNLMHLSYDQYVTSLPCLDVVEMADEYGGALRTLYRIEPVGWTGPQDKDKGPVIYEIKEGPWQNLILKPSDAEHILSAPELKLAVGFNQRNWTERGDYPPSPLNSAAFNCTDNGKNRLGMIINAGGMGLAEELPKALLDSIKEIIKPEDDELDLVLGREVGEDIAYFPMSLDLK